MAWKAFSLVSLFLIASQDYIFAQSARNFELGISMMITDVNIKDQLFSQEKILNGDDIYPGLEINVSRSLSKNFRLETGLQYFYSSFLTTVSNSEFTLLDLDQNNQIQYDLLDDNPLGNYAATASFQWDASNCNEPFDNGFSITASQKNKVNFQSIGVPIRLEYLHGTNPIQPYFSASLTPSIHLSKRLDVNLRNAGMPTLFPDYCSSNFDLANTNFGIDHNTEVIDFKVKDFFISTLFSAGIKHTGKHTAYKLGIVYGGSNINFSSTDSDRVVKEILALNFGMSIRL